MEDGACRFDSDAINLISFQSNHECRPGSRATEYLSATVTLAFPVSHFIHIRAKPHQFPLVELDWHFGNPSTQERFKTSHLRSKRNMKLARNGLRKNEGRNDRKRRNKGQ